MQEQIKSIKMVVSARIDYSLADIGVEYDILLVSCDPSDFHSKYLIIVKVY